MASGWPRGQPRHAIPPVPPKTAKSGRQPPSSAIESHLRFAESFRVHGPISTSESAAVSTPPPRNNSLRYSIGHFHINYPTFTITENACQKGRQLSILKSQLEIAGGRDIFFRGDPNHERQAGEQTDGKWREAAACENIRFQPFPGPI